MDLSDRLRGVRDIFKGFGDLLQWLFSGGGYFGKAGKRKEANKIVNSYLDEFYGIKAAKDDTDEDIKNIKDRKTRKIVKAVINLLLTNKEIANMNETEIKLYIESFMHLIFFYAYNIYLEKVTNKEKNGNDFRKLYSGTAEVFLGLDRKYLSSFFKKFKSKVSKVYELSMRSFDANQKKNYKEKGEFLTERSKLLDKMQKDRFKVLDKILKIGRVKKSIYETQIKELKDFKNDSPLVKENEVLEDRVEKIIRGKEKTLEWVKKQVDLKDFYKGTGIDVWELLPITNKFSNKFFDFFVEEIFSEFGKKVAEEGSVIHTSLMVLAYFMSEERFVPKLRKSFKHLNKDQRKWNLNKYFKYVNGIIDRFTDEKKEILRKLLSATESVIEEHKDISEREAKGEGLPIIEGEGLTTKDPRKALGEGILLQLKDSFGKTEAQGDKTRIAEENTESRREMIEELKRIKKGMSGNGKVIKGKKKVVAPGIKKTI